MAKPVKYPAKFQKKLDAIRKERDRREVRERERAAQPARPAAAPMSKQDTAEVALMAGLLVRSILRRGRFTT